MVANSPFQWVLFNFFFFKYLALHTSKLFSWKCRTLHSCKFRLQSCHLVIFVNITFTVSIQEKCMQFLCEWNSEFLLMSSYLSWVDSVNSDSRERQRVPAVFEPRLLWYRLSLDTWHAFYPVSRILLCVGLFFCLFWKCFNPHNAHSFPLRNCSAAPECPAYNIWAICVCLSVCVTAGHVLCLWLWLLKYAYVHAHMPPVIQRLP